jgi:membrane protease YdiL (CAAX protease family)
VNPYSILLFGAVHLIYFGLIKPYQTWRARNVWPVPPPPRVQHYQRTASHLLACGCLTVMTMTVLAWSSSRAPIATDILVLGQQVARPRDVWFGLLPREWPGVGSLVLGAVAYAALVTIELAHARRSLTRSAHHMHVDTPRTRRERVGWVAVSGLAAVTEELTWRGLQPELIAQLVGALWPAAVVCAATFGFGHIGQGWLYVLVAFLYSLVFHVLTLVTGSLVVAMFVHAAINVTGGLRAGTWAARSEPGGR